MTNDLLSEYETGFIDYCLTLTPLKRKNQLRTLEARIEDLKEELELGDHYISDSMDSFYHLDVLEAAKSAYIQLVKIIINDDMKLSSGMKGGRRIANQVNKDIESRISKEDLLKHRAIEQAKKLQDEERKAEAKRKHQERDARLKALNKAAYEKRLSENN